MQLTRVSWSVATKKAHSDTCGRCVPVHVVVQTPCCVWWVCVSSPPLDGSLVLLVWERDVCNTEMKEACSKSYRRYRARHVCLQRGWWGGRPRQFAEAASAKEGPWGQEHVPAFTVTLPQSTRGSVLHPHGSSVLKKYSVTLSASVQTQRAAKWTWRW